MEQTLAIPETEYGIFGKFFAVTSVRNYNRPCRENGSRQAGTRSRGVVHVPSPKPTKYDYNGLERTKTDPLKQTKNPTIHPLTQVKTAKLVSSDVSCGSKIL